MVWKHSTRRNCATKHCNSASMPVRLAKPFPFSLTEIGQIFAQNVITSRKHCRHSLASSLLLAEEECHSFSKGKMPNRCSSECLVMETEGEQNLLFALFILQELNPPAWLSNYCELMCYLFAHVERSLSMVDVPYSLESNGEARRNSPEVKCINCWITNSKLKLVHEHIHSSYSVGIKLFGISPQLICARLLEANLEIPFSKEDLEIYILTWKVTRHCRS